MQAQGNQYSTFYGLIDAARDGRFNVVAVEKPNASPTPVREAGTAKNCPTEFNRTFTLNSWTTALQRVLDAQPETKSGRVPVYLLGVSEGAVAAARIAGMRPGQIDRLALVGLSGSTQALDFVLRTYGTADSDQATSSELAELGASFAEIARDPGSSEKFFAGHPYRRWSSFFAADPTSDLLRSGSAVRLVSGMKDTSVPIQSTERVWATLAASGHDVEFKRVPDADHGLMNVEQPDMKAVSAEFREIFEWLANGRENAETSGLPINSEDTGSPPARGRRNTEE